MQAGPLSLIATALQQFELLESSQHDILPANLVLDTLGKAVLPISQDGNPN